MLLMPLDQFGQEKFEDSNIIVISSKWIKSRRKADKSDDYTPTTPQPAMTSDNKNFQRNRRVNDPVGAIDPNSQTIDGRSAALEKITQESRKGKPTDSEGFTYQAKFKNMGSSTIEILFWEYEFRERANQNNITSHQFLCGVNIKPNKDKELIVFSTSSPGNFITANEADKQTKSPFEERIIINRVEYSDGTIWQRKEWNYSKMKQSINHALETPWGMEMCRPLN